MSNSELTASPRIRPYAPACHNRAGVAASAGLGFDACVRVVANFSRAGVDRATIGDPG